MITAFDTANYRSWVGVELHGRFSAVAKRNLRGRKKCCAQANIALSVFQCRATLNKSSLLKQETANTNKFIKFQTQTARVLWWVMLAGDAFGSLSPSSAIVKREALTKNIWIRSVHVQFVVHSHLEMSINKSTRRNISLLNWNNFDPIPSAGMRNESNNSRSFSVFVSPGICNSVTVNCELQGDEFYEQLNFMFSVVLWNFVLVAHPELCSCRSSRESFLQVTEKVHIAAPLEC